MDNIRTIYTPTLGFSSFWDVFCFVGWQVGSYDRCLNLFLFRVPQKLL
jgi:hypothetical protein